MATDTTLLVLVGGGSGEPNAFAELDAIGQALSERLHIPVQSALLEASDMSVGERILQGITAHQPRSMVLMPVFLGSAAKYNTVKLILEAAHDRWPEIAMVCAQPPGLHSGVSAAYAALVRDAMADHDQNTALLVVGQGSRDAQANAAVRQMAAFIGQAVPVLTVETAFYETQPDMRAGINACVAAGAETILVAPYVLYERWLYDMIAEDVQTLQRQHDVSLRLTAHPGADAALLGVLSERYEEALAELASTNGVLVRTHSHSHGGQAHTHRQVSSSPEDLLPPRYQGGVTVSAAPMGAADLIFDADGQVAWDDIWTGFCDLALAGGPPHRGTLLEPVMPDAVSADPERYAAVLAEIARGITMVTQLPVITTAAPGWIGIQCDSEEMALWLLRAIIVENVSVRREGSVLYLPAGPQFRLDKEIKNVVTVVAKTHHYWTEHLNNQTSSAKDAS